MKTYVDSTVQKKQKSGVAKEFQLILTAGMILLAAVLLFISLYYIHNFKDQYISRTSNAINAIAGIKARQVEAWKADRIKDASLVKANSRIASLAIRFSRDPSNQVLSERLTNELKPFTSYHPYEFFLVNGQSELLYSWPGDHSGIDLEQYQPWIYENENEVVFVDFHRTLPNGEFANALIVPLQFDLAGTNLYLIMIMKPQMGLFSAFLSYTPAMVNVKNYFIFSYNDHYFAWIPEETMHNDSFISISRKAAEDGAFGRLLSDNLMIKKGDGLLGNLVYAGLRNIEGTNWMVLVEMKENELLSAVRQRGYAIGILAVAFLLCNLALVLIFARQHEIRMLNFSRENEILLDDLIHNQPSGIYRVALEMDKHFSEPDPERLFRDNVTLKFIFVSRQHEVITGIAEKEIMENSSAIFDVVHPEDRDIFLQRNLEAIEEIKRFTWEGRMVVNGRVKWVSYDSVPRLNPPGQVIWTGVVRDITTQKELEFEMDEREAFEKLLISLSSSFVNVTVANFDTIVESALQRIGEYYNIDRAYIFLYDPNEDTISNTHEWCNESIVSQKDELQGLPVSIVPQWVGTLQKFQPVVIPDVSEMDDSWSSEKKILDPQGIKSVVAVPSISDHKLKGFVGLDSVKQYREWKDYEIQLLRVFADLVYSALERVNAEQSVIESQKMLRSVIDTIKVRVFWKDKSLKFRGCNVAFAKDAGFASPEEVIGLNDLQMSWEEFARKYQQDDMLVMKTGQPLLNMEEEHVGKDGRIKWVSTSKIPLRDSSGDIIGILGTYQDITETKLAEEALKKSEKRYRILTENAFDGIYLLRGITFDYVNQKFCELTGFSYHELTSPFFDIFTLFDEESKQKAAQRKEARDQGIPIPSTYEMRLITKSGLARDVEISTNNLSTAGEESLILGIMRDITERKSNELLRNEVDIANQSAVFKQNFLANMSHEIRTPLTGVLGMIEILAGTNLDPEQSDYVNTLKLSTENLREIINQILDYSKIEAGEVKLKMVVFKTAAVFNNARKLYQAASRENVELRIQIDEAIPEYIEADEQRLSQVVNNLLSNAIKFTPEGYITIKASVDQLLTDNDLLIRIVIEDTGIGIHPHALDRLFKPFGQVDHEDKRHFDGTGLGLSICKELVMLMQGDIGVSSHEGKGSSFWFTFKTRRMSFNNLMVPDQRKKKSKTTHCLHILYAEDKVVNQKVVKLMLNAMGHLVTIASNGKEVIEMFTPERFDLILMDIQMPVMDGITATQLLREKFGKLPPIVGLSANAFEGDREKYMQQGMDEYLTKPVNTNDLKALIEKICGNRKIS